ncbi:MAG: PilN domain-containing protein [Desulfovermiculus sp.]
MLTINLLPHKKKARAADSRKQILLAILIGLLVITGLVQANHMLSTKIDNLSQEKKLKVKTQKKLSKDVSRIKEIKALLKDMQERVSIIREIRYQQSLPVRYLDEIASHVREDKMWFESLSLDNQGRIILSGVALDNQVFANYLHQLRLSSFISDIALQQTQRKTIQGLRLVEFRCSISAAPAHPEGEKNRAG